MKVEIIVDPRSNVSYGSFYLKELEDKYGAASIHYCLCPFASMDDIGNDLRFIMSIGDQTIRYFIHTNDSYKILEKDYEWCDIYGCVNANYTNYPRNKYPKLVSLSPSFGIVRHGLIPTMWQTTLNLLKGWRSVVRRKEWNKITNRLECHKVRNVKHFLSRAYKDWKWRRPYDAYCPGESDGNYVFFLSTLWYSDLWNKNDEGVNLRRANFIRACKSLPIRFEGGFVPRSGTIEQADAFKDCLAQEITMQEWIDKTKRSALVFNTPAFWDCHGWKLGEYLALGKCIISTPLSNNLPAPLEHGVNIHYVDNTEESMAEAIKYILDHPDYRHRLELGAREYWQKYGTPSASLKLLGIV